LGLFAGHWDSLLRLMGVMERRRCDRADGEMVGMITRADFVRVLALLVGQPYQEAGSATMMLSVALKRK